MALFYAVLPISGILLIIYFAGESERFNLKWHKCLQALRSEVSVMGMTAFVLLLWCFILLILSVPISFSIGIATLVTMLIEPWNLTLTVSHYRPAYGWRLDSFALLAIPFFVSLRFNHGLGWHR